MSAEKLFFFRKIACLEGEGGILINCLTGIAGKTKMLTARMCPLFQSLLCRQELLVGDQINIAGFLSVLLSPTWLL